MRTKMFSPALAVKLQASMSPVSMVEVSAAWAVEVDNKQIAGSAKRHPRFSVRIVVGWVGLVELTNPSAKWLDSERFAHVRSRICASLTFF